MKKIFFFDIDGTFVSEKTNEILPSTKLAYEKLLANNYDVYLCTGRNLRDTNKIAGLIGTESFICSNGQYIQIEGKPYFTRFITTSEKKRYLPELSNAVWGYMTAHDVKMIENDSGLEKEVFDEYWMEYSYATVEDYLAEDVISLIIIDDKKDNYPIISSENNMYFWSGNHYQVVPGDINKGIGIKELIKSYNEPVEVICFGDNDNDVQMFKIADVAVAMANGTEDAKKSADIITDKASEDGIYKGLVKLGVINE